MKYYGIMPASYAVGEKVHVFSRIYRGKEVKYYDCVVPDKVNDEVDVLLPKSLLKESHLIFAWE
jgi:hypothetical protein